MVTPLRKRWANGQLYERAAEVEAQILALENLSSVDIVRACRAPEGSIEYVRPECVLYYLRRARGDVSLYEPLYGILVRRFLRQMPRPDAADGATASAKNMLIQQLALDTLNALLSADAHGYDERLDFWEVRFRASVARRRKEAERIAWREENRERPLIDEETGDVSTAVEEAAGIFDPFDVARKHGVDYRSRLDAAINGLPPEQIRIVEMLRKGMPIESKDPAIVSIVGVTGLAEKTVRNRRDRAFAALRRAMEDGDAS